MDPFNALEAVDAGMRYIQTTLLGVGERSGITSMTALLFNLYIDKAYDHLEGYSLRGSYPINVMFASKLKKLVPSKEPVNLTNSPDEVSAEGQIMIDGDGYLHFVWVEQGLRDVGHRSLRSLFAWPPAHVERVLRASRW